MQEAARCAVHRCNTKSGLSDGTRCAGDSSKGPSCNFWQAAPGATVRL